MRFTGARVLDDATGERLDLIAAEQQWSELSRHGVLGAPVRPRPIRLPCARADRFEPTLCSAVHGAPSTAVTIVRSVSGTRVDCDRCGTHAASPDLSLEQLRRATAYVHVQGTDLCPDCAPAPNGAPARRTDAVRSAVGAFDALALADAAGLP